jgi:hypothetical protein
MFSPLSIALDTRFFFLILRPLSSMLLFALLPHGNLGEPSTTPGILFAHCAFDVALSPPRFTSIAENLLQYLAPNCLITARKGWR